MKLTKGTRIKIVNYGHKVMSKKGDIKDMMPQLVGKSGTIIEVGPGYIIKLDDHVNNVGWIEEGQVEEIV